MAEGALFGVAASLLAGAMTGLGGLVVAGSGVPDPRRQNLLIGFAAGVMIAAAVFSLILPAFTQMRGGGASLAYASLGVVAAVWVGALAMGRLGLWAERLAARGLLPAQVGSIDERRVALFVVAITLHNLPEGAAVGLSFMGDDPSLGWATMLGIGLQNVPEGMAVAALLASLGWSRARCAGAALATGLAHPPPDRSRIGNARRDGRARADDGARHHLRLTFPLQQGPPRHVQDRPPARQHPAARP